MKLYDDLKDALGESAALSRKALRNEMVELLDAIWEFNQKMKAKETTERLDADDEKRDAIDKAVKAVKTADELLRKALG